MFRIPGRMLLMLFLLALPVGPVAANAIVPFDPQNVTAPTALERDRVTRAVVEALVIRGWRMTTVNREEGYIDAELPVRAHVGRVRVRIGDEVVSFSYRDSDNLDHGWLTPAPNSKKGAGDETYFTKTRQTDDDIEAVHRNYLAWINELARTIDGTLMLAVLEQRE